jgi:lipoprotein-anchoring transpeptidase ErfK/SrfK
MALSPQQASACSQCLHISERRRFSPDRKQYHIPGMGESSAGAVNYELFTIATELAGPRRIDAENARLRLVCAKCARQNQTRIRGRWGFVLSINFRVVLAASAVATALVGSPGSACAQYYPVPAGPPPYERQPVYRDANGVPYHQDAYGRLYAPQPLPAEDGGQVFQRPPGDVAGGDPADVTGSIRAASPSNRRTVVASLPPEDQPEQGPASLAPQFRRQVVDYNTIESAGTIIIDTPHTYLYLVLGGGKAMRYGIGVGREGFTWTGTERISRMKEWPDWLPPKEMIERQPYLPRFMAGGETNPLGARAMYLGGTLYRIHGTNQPSTIGTFVSSGCIRLTNDDVSDLYSRVSVGTRVVVMPGAQASAAASQAPAQVPVAR